jgi:hypothetical protein
VDASSLHSPRQHTYEFDFETLRVVIVPQFELLVSSFHSSAMIDSIKDNSGLFFSEGLMIRSFSLFRLCRRTCFRTQGLIFLAVAESFYTFSRVVCMKIEDEHENGEAEPLASPWCVFFIVVRSEEQNMRDDRDDVMPCS